MRALRCLLRRWLGIPTRGDIRAIVLREIDADAAWRDGSAGQTPACARREREIQRLMATTSGRREDTRA
jgi:hypothetical protein